MREGIVETLSSLVDVRYLLLYKGAVLVLALGFFSVVYLLGAMLRRPVSLSKATATIKIALLGLLFLLAGAVFPFGPSFSDALGKVVSLLVVVCAANLVAYAAVDLYLHRRKRGEVPSIQRELVTLFVYMIFAVSYLRVVLRIDVGTILTTTTIITAALAFAMQATLANILSGFYIQNDPNLKAGTWVALKDRNIEGKVENVGFRHTTLRTVDRHKVLVPNHYLMQNVVVTLGNPRDEEYGAVNLKVHLGFEQPPEKVRGILLPVLRHQEGIVQDPPPSVWVTGFEESSVQYNVKFYLEDPGNALAMKGKVFDKIWYALSREGIAFPYPHREIVEKVPKSPFEFDEAAVLEMIRNTEIFSALDEREARCLAEKANVMVFGPGEVVVREGAPGDSLFLVGRGSLQVFVGGTPVGTLDEGDLFGEMSLLTGDPRRATVVSAEEARLIEVEKGGLEPVLRSDPSLVGRLSDILARREEINLARSRSSVPVPSRDSLVEGFVRRLKSYFNIQSVSG